MSEETRKGTRCAVCTGCGKCFAADEGAASAKGWTGKRCAVCVSCGECAKAWGLGGSSGDVDGVSGATNWADAFKVMDTGSAGAPPPVQARPGETAPSAESGEKLDAVSGASMKSAECDEVDASTGATPGVATACKELGLDDMAAVLESRGIKPPGER